MHARLFHPGFGVMPVRFCLSVLLGAALAGCSDETGFAGAAAAATAESAGPATAPPADRSPAAAQPATTPTGIVPAGAAPTGRRFPVEGTWIWADGGRWLPARNVGCRESQAKLSLKPHAIEVAAGAWHHAAFTVIEWHAAAADRVRLRLEEKTSLGRRRLLVTLNLAEPGFVRFADATDERGRPLAGYRERDGREIGPEEDRAMLAKAFTLIRCAGSSPAPDATALLRGATPGERLRVIR
ncbi:hypothetical protein [Prosthecomicrobium hirschii]|uniref:hypothetical protein n=1 Tax=Prosthecodimorpha hirschii TaxID=665126 RepID=UPI00221F44D3|nr:hypothetical protein [Prosthecomicrobium hirschii]MCW1838911.1 hypothetical protein [Prosthecomicrobium hirschii]